MNAFNLEEKKIILMLGAGGVGKTTTSIAMAFHGLKQGKKKIGLLSIDPAKRLADALGIPLGTSPKKIPINHKNYPGEIHAAMVDQKEIFDQMVRTYAPSASVAAKILDHPIYKAASTELSGPLEYMALAQLQAMISSNSYDLIIVDTPPDSHALDFLSRPNILSDFMENKVMSWLIKPFHMASKIGIGRLFNHGERLMGGLAKVTGLQALKLVAEFLILMQQVIEGFHQHGEKIKKTLKDPRTGFFLVSAPNQASFNTAEFLKHQLENKGYHLRGWILNKCLSPKIKNGTYIYEKLYQEKKLPMIEGMEALSVRASLEKKLMNKLKEESIPVIITLAESNASIESEEAIWGLADQLNDLVI